MLIKLVRNFLAAYRGPLTVVVGLQFIGTVMALYLPSLNADIIDHGVVTGDTGYIIRIGAVMLVVALVQIVCSVGAVWFGARTAMGFGRDVRASIFHRVGTFSQREVQSFGAPSLITRETNDVQQVQMLVLMSCTLMVMAPIMMVGGIVMAIHVDVGLSWLVAVTVPVLAILLGLIITRMVPSFRLMQGRIDEVNRLLREQITGVRVVRAFVREPLETKRFENANSDLTSVAVRAGRYQALMFPTVMLVANVASVGVLWFGGHRVDSGDDAGRRPDGVPLVPHADRDVGDDGHLHDDDDPEVGGLRRPGHGGPADLDVGAEAGRAGHRHASSRHAAAGLRRVQLPGRGRTRSA